MRVALWLFALPVWWGTGLASTVLPTTTPCPTVSDNSSILPVNLVNAPRPVGYAGYDLNTGYLTVSYSNSYSEMFIGVPESAVLGVQVQYGSISGFHEAIMQEHSTCPLLTENNVPIWSR